MSIFVVHGIVPEDLKMCNVYAKLMPILLTKDQKELRVLQCQKLLDLIQNKPNFLNSVVTGEKSGERSRIDKAVQRVAHKIIP